MKSIVAAVLALLLAVPDFAAPPTDQSIEELLRLTQVQRLLASMQQRVDAIFSASMSQALQGQKLSPEALQIQQTFQRKMSNTLKQELSWDAMKSLYVQVYRESFTQQEINDLIAFYQSKTGKMVVEKMPVVMQKSLTLVQQRMGPMMQRMQQDMRETLREVHAAQVKTSVPARR